MHPNEKQTQEAIARWRAGDKPEPTPMDRIAKDRLMRERLNLQDLAVAADNGLHPPQAGQQGVYEPPGQSPVTFEVIKVEGMICKCLYAWQDHDAEPSCFIWGFLSGYEYNRFHVWKGHPDWGV